MCGRACHCIHLAHLYEWDFSIPPIPFFQSPPSLLCLVTLPSRTTKHNCGCGEQLLMSIMHHWSWGISRRRTWRHVMHFLCVLTFIHEFNIYLLRCWKIIIHLSNLLMLDSKEKKYILIRSREFDFSTTWNDTVNLCSGPGGGRALT